LASDIYGTVVGGCRNKNFGKYTFIGNGVCNVICNSISNCYTIGTVIVGGIGNNTTGGTWNLATCSFTVDPTQTSTSAYSFIGGGFQNRISNGASFSNIGGGNKNLVDGGYSSIFGGILNTISGSYSGILSGKCNKICAGSSGFIGSGCCNTMSNVYSFSAIVSGCCNTSSGQYGYIGGGLKNSIGVNSYVSVIVGGQCNCATEQYNAISGGYGAKAYLYGQQVNANGFFANIGDNQSTKLIAWTKATVNANGTKILALDGVTSDNIVIPNNTIWSVNAQWIISVQTVGAGAGGAIQVGSTHVGNTQFFIKNIGTTTSISLKTNVSSKEDALMGTSSVDFTAGTEKLTVTFQAPSAGGTAGVYYVNCVLTIDEINVAGTS
jgi:hypothetical protein